jgi:DNA-binding CsgD family transcriptional regulator
MMVSMNDEVQEGAWPQGVTAGAKHRWDKMMEGTAATLLGLTEDALKMYQWALQFRRFTRDQAFEHFTLSGQEIEIALSSLLSLRLVKQTPGDSETFFAVSPDAAIVDATGPLASRIQHLHQEADQLAAGLQGLLPLYLEQRGARAERPVLDKLGHGTEVRHVLTAASQQCTTEMFGVQSETKHDPDVIEDSLPRDLAMIARGVKVRSLYLHTARAHRSTCSYLNHLVEAGAEVRTTDHIVERLLIFDDTVAFLPDRLSDATPGAVVIREPAIIRFLRGWAEHLWSTAVPFVPGEAGYGESADRLRESIVQMLAAGIKDEVIARRLDISIRTCRRHIAEVLTELDASSRFQAGVNAVRSGRLNLGPQNPPRRAATPARTDIA